MKKNNSANTQKTPVFFRRRDIVIIAAVLILAVVLFFVWRQVRTPGGTAKITVINGQQSQSFTVPLAKDDILYIEDAALPVTLQVEGGRIRFINSACPDHLCENTGWLANQGESAICLPAGVWVEVVS